MPQHRSLIIQYSSQSTSVWVVSDRERGEREREPVYECCERELMKRCDEGHINLSGALSPSGGPRRIVALLT